MDLLFVGSANQYAKNMARRTQWNLKKQSGDFTGHQKSLGDYVNITKASSILPQTDETDYKMSAIITKAQAGKKLSPDDWEYLKTKNPVLYEELRQEEREQEAYEKALRRCKTKDEAQRLHMSKLGDIMTAAKNGDESAIYRLNRLTRSMTAFTQSREYHEMPTEAEEAIERENERRAREEALREEAAREAQAVSEAEPDEETDMVSEDAAKDTDAISEKNAKAEADAISGKGTKARVKAGSGTKAAKIASDIPRTAARSGHAPVNHDAAPVLSVGQRAYLNQSGGNPRRRTLDAKA